MIFCCFFHKTNRLLAIIGCDSYEITDDEHYEVDAVNELYDGDKYDALGDVRNWYDDDCWMQ